MISEFQGSSNITINYDINTAGQGFAMDAVIGRVARPLGRWRNFEKWVPRSSRTLRRAGTGLLTLNGFGPKDLNEPVKICAIGSIVPALAQNATTGHPQFRSWKEKTRLKAWQWSSYRHYAEGERGAVLVNELRKAELKIRKVA